VTKTARRYSAIAAGATRRANVNARRAAEFYGMAANARAAARLVPEAAAHWERNAALLTRCADSSLASCFRAVEDAAFYANLAASYRSPVALWRAVSAARSAVIFPAARLRAAGVTGVSGCPTLPAPDRDAGEGTARAAAITTTRG